MKYCSSTFRQSLNDFPCSIELGKKIPSFGINRWGVNALQFVPFDDEGFTLKGDKKRLLYKGRRRSHRFTILNDEAFEYDCILLKEPESNVITLRMEGAEQYDFFRQPDFVPDDFLKGSYAVYKKETLIGQGTGKLCHIHRPLIIDSRGRKIWGELAVIGDYLHITIPEWWLASAKYPVTVDPTIGTTTQGLQTTAAFQYASGMTENGLMGAIVVNSFYINEAFNGTATAYVYLQSRSNTGQCKPILYSDAANMYPSQRRSTNEGDFDIVVNLTDKPAGWRSTTFNTSTNINTGYIWFGLSAARLYFVFDYGNKAFWWAYNNNTVNIPNSFPLFPDQRNFNYKISMYFTYSNPQDYVRTLTQGVTLNETTKSIAEYKRIAIQNVKINDNTKSAFFFLRQCVSKVYNNMTISRKPEFFRSVFENINTGSELKNRREIKRNIVETKNITETIARYRGFTSIIIDNLFSTDDMKSNVLIIRIIKNTQIVSDVFTKINEYFCKLYEEAGIIEQIEKNGKFNRKQTDSITADGSVLRKLSIFIKLVSTCFVRDFLLKRFLIAREEIVLKSKVTLELTLESKIN